MVLSSDMFRRKVYSLKTIWNCIWNLLEKLGEWFLITLGQKALGYLPGENLESEMNNGTPQSHLMKELDEALAISKLQ